MLYIVATPIGNLGDMSLRAVETLKAADFIVAENPLYTKRLLDHYEIKGKPLKQFAEHNEERVLASLVASLKEGDGCLVTDAGTPGVSDPGFRLVRACIDAGLAVTPIPGPSAVIAALSSAGLPTDRFLFVGFLPKTAPKVGQVLEQAKQAAATLVFYESPQRLLKTLKILADSVPDVQLVIARELTKMHEEFVRGTVIEVEHALAKRPAIKGEIVGLLSFKG